MDDRLAVADHYNSGFGNSSRLLPNNGSTTMTSGAMYLTYFTPDRTRAVGSVGTYSGTTPAGATPTVCRIGIFQENASDGSLTLIAKTANDTTLWNAANSFFQRNLLSGVSLEQGFRYATALLVVTAAATPTTTAFIGASSILLARQPRICGYVPSLTDIPDTVTAASIVEHSRVYYVDMFTEPVGSPVTLLDLQLD